MGLLTAAALFVSAFLLFSLQPLIGRMLLPMLGGSPAVWNTCLVFFQATLLAGYLYAHRLAASRSPMRQVMIHCGLLLLPILFLPIALPSTISSAVWEAPILGLLVILIVMAGVPFFVVATTGPLLQRWYAVTSQRDPYFLYAASNAGSMLGLLAYPFVIEPRLTLADQNAWWAMGYGLFACCVLLCAIALMVRVRTAASPFTPTANPTRSLSPWRILALAFVPSSWLMGVTTYLSTDLAAIPLLWVVPLALYLLTFIIAFSTIRLPLQLGSRFVAIGSLILMLTLLIGATEPLILVVGLHLLVFFVAAMYCHGTLAVERPPPEQLTQFYLWLSLGGVLGGIFNALIAPLVFTRLGLIEYPLMAIAIGLFRPSLERYPTTFRRDAIWVSGLLLLSFGMLAIAGIPAIARMMSSLAESSGLPHEVLRSAAIFGIPAIVAYTLIDYPRRFVMGLGVLFLVGMNDPGAQGEIVHLERHFLGVVKITRSPDGRFLRMVHGNTIHGQQLVAPRRSDMPLTYYHPSGPAGDLFLRVIRRDERDSAIALVGLGTGSLAYYARPNEAWTFYELDPTVERLARNPAYFTYLTDTKARSLNVVVGDARLRFADVPEGTYRLIVLDAFSSDAIPLHLLTVEALELYRKKLTPDGILAFHVSNRYLDLPPILARLAQHVEPPFQVLLGDDLVISDTDKEQGKYPSRWVVLAPPTVDLQPLKRNYRWSPVTPRPDTPLWTDDFSNLLSAFRRSEFED